MPDDPLIDYLERTFGDSYRKEIDQEENVWRSLPFFTATLALQLAALAQIRDWLAGQAGGFLLASEVLLLVTAAMTTGAVVLLAVSVWPADFDRVLSEPDFLAFVRRVRSAVEEAAPDAEETEVARIVLDQMKANLVQQYAKAAGHNRAVNRHRERWRTLAGLATLGAVLSTLVLVALVVLSNLHVHG